MQQVQNLTDFISVLKVYPSLCWKKKDDLHCQWKYAVHTVTAYEVKLFI